MSDVGSVVVVGGTRAIGLGVVREYVARGESVVVIGRHADHVEAAHVRTLQHVVPSPGEGIATLGGTLAWPLATKPESYVYSAGGGADCVAASTAEG